MFFDDDGTGNEPIRLHPVICNYNPYLEIVAASVGRDRIDELNTVKLHCQNCGWYSSAYGMNTSTYYLFKIAAIHTVECEGFSE